MRHVIIYIYALETVVGVLVFTMGPHARQGDAAPVRRMATPHENSPARLHTATAYIQASWQNLGGMCGPLAVLHWRATCSVVCGMGMVAPDGSPTKLTSWWAPLSHRILKKF